MTCPKEKRHGGNRGVSENAGTWDGSGSEHTYYDVPPLFLVRVALDAAQAQLDVYALATDDPLPGVVDAADLLDAAAIGLAQLADFAPTKKGANGGAA